MQPFLLLGHQPATSQPRFYAFPVNYYTKTPKLHQDSGSKQKVQNIKLLLYEGICKCNISNQYFMKAYVFVFVLGFVFLLVAVAG